MSIGGARPPLGAGPGRTSLRLHDKINQHIPKSIRNKENPTKVLPKRNCKITTPLNQRDRDSATGKAGFTNRLGRLKPRASVK